MSASVIACGGGSSGFCATADGPCGTQPPSAGAMSEIARTESTSRCSWAWLSSL
jgi:hypothetical protein